MRAFRFALVQGDQQFPLASRVELPYGLAACTHAEAAIKHVFQNTQDIFEWSDWHVSVRDNEDQEFAVLSIIDTVGGERRAVSGR